MNDVLVVGAGPAGLLAAWRARQRGGRVRLVASGIGTTHISPGWIGVLDSDGDLSSALQGWIGTHPRHPYALAGLGALSSGLSALREVMAEAGLEYVGDLRSNYLLPTALGATMRAAVVPRSFAAGDLRDPGSMLIAGPAGWRDFYPGLCAGNLVRQGFSAHSATFDLPELHAGKFDATPLTLARLFDRADVRERVAAQLKPCLEGAARVGVPAVLGLAPGVDVSIDLSERLGVPVFEIPTLPPSVPGIRLFTAFKTALMKAGVQILLGMTAERGVIEGRRAVGVVIPGAVRDTTYGADTIVLATGGLYGGGITTDHTGAMREAVFDLPLDRPGGLESWFGPESLGVHAAHFAGVRVNRDLQPLDETGRTVLENVRIAGRLLAGHAAEAEGSTEGVWLATGYRAGCV